MGPVAPVGPTIPALKITKITSLLLEKLVVPVPPDVVRVTGISTYPVCSVGVPDTVHFW
jgi:hypothetical protein